LKLLYEYLTVLGVDDVVEFDLSLARGLDYYTGVIYEVVIDGTDGVGSIAAGGRYDNLVGMFSGKNVPCVGVSIGVERVFAIMQKKKTVSAPTTKVMVVSPDGNLIARMKCARLLWEADIETEFIYKEKPKIKSQLSACDSKGIPIAVIIGQKEIDMGGATVKILTSKKEEFVPNQELISYIKKALNQ
jgi:histidyl-tRNA synthetase